MRRVAVLVPCFNEAATIARVVRDFRAQLPGADVYVFDNNSTDGSAELARAEGAHVQLVPRRGKGEVVRAMFRDVDADVYVMVDGDSTYPADRVGDLVAPVVEGRAEMVVGTRLSEFGDDALCCAPSMRRSARSCATSCRGTARSAGVS